jgi:hypothetical protein
MHYWQEYQLKLKQASSLQKEFKKYFYGQYIGV